MDAETARLRRTILHLADAERVDKSEINNRTTHRGGEHGVKSCATARYFAALQRRSTGTQRGYLPPQGPRPCALDHTPSTIRLDQWPGKAAHGRLAVEAMVVGTADRREAVSARPRPPRQWPGKAAHSRRAVEAVCPTADRARGRQRLAHARLTRRACVAPPIAAKAVSALPRAVSRAGLCPPPSATKAVSASPMPPDRSPGRRRRERPLAASIRKGHIVLPSIETPASEAVWSSASTPHARAPRRLWSSRREGRQRLPPPADHVPVAAARRSSARPGPRAPGPRPRARLPPASSARLRPAPAPAFAFLRRGFAGKPAHGRLAPRPRLHARQPQTPASDPPQARQQWPCRGESGSEARSRTREPSKASQCAAAHIQEGNCMNVSRSPAEPVEAWHGFSCQRRKAERRGEICNVFRKPSAVACVCTVLAKPRSCWPCKQRRRAQAIVFMYYRQYS